MKRAIVSLSALMCMLIFATQPGMSKNILESTKIFTMDYKTCYERTENILKDMQNVSIYAKKDNKISLNYIYPNTTPVDITFTAVDPTHTKVTVFSQSPTAKEWIAKHVFSDTPMKPDNESSVVPIRKGHW